MQTCQRAEDINSDWLVGVQSVWTLYPVAQSLMIRGVADDSSDVRRAGRASWSSSGFGRDEVYRTLSLEVPMTHPALNRPPISSGIWRSYSSSDPGISLWSPQLVPLGLCLHLGVLGRLDASREYGATLAEGR